MAPRKKIVESIVHTKVFDKNTGVAYLLMTNSATGEKILDGGTYDPKIHVSEKVFAKRSKT